MLIVAYACFREGLFTAFLTLVNLVLAGVITYNFWEPLADALDSTLQGSILDGYQDFLLITVIFALALGLLRLITNNLANSLIEFTPTVQQFAGAAVGLLTGYLLSGFLICAFETLPWHRNFIDFQPRSRGESAYRRFFPPDRIWLALMRHAGAYPFARGATNDKAESPYEKYPTFDWAGTFELRYSRYRRYSDADDPLPYGGELEKERHSPRPPEAAPAAPAPAAPPPQPAVTPVPKKDAPQTPAKTPGKAADDKGKAAVPPDNPKSK
jgi:hypothetical protein